MKKIIVFTGLKAAEFLSIFVVPCLLGWQFSIKQPEVYYHTFRFFSCFGFWLAGLFVLGTTVILFCVVGVVGVGILKIIKINWDWADTICKK